MNIPVPGFLKRQDQTTMPDNTSSAPITRPLPKSSADTPHVGPIAFAPRCAMSAKAAEAAAEWEQLETAYGVASQERDEWRNKAKLFEEANEMLHRELDRVEAKAAFHEKMNTIVWTKVTDALDIIESIRRLPSPHNTPATVSKTDAEAAVEKALLDDTTQTTATLHPKPEPRPGVDPRPHSIQQQEEPKS